MLRIVSVAFTLRCAAATIAAVGRAGPGHVRRQHSARRPGTLP